MEILNDVNPCLDEKMDVHGHVRTGQPLKSQSV